MTVPASITSALAEIGTDVAYVAGAILLAIVVVKCIRMLGNVFIFGRGGRFDTGYDAERDKYY